MKLSEAIRKGCETTLQSYEMFIDRSGQTIRACVLGAAYLGLREALPTTYADIWHQIDDALLELCGMKWGDPIIREIVIFNDREHWSREAIADWLESRGL